MCIRDRYYSLDFKGAVEMLAKEYGISLEGAFRTSKDKDESYEICLLYTSDR